ncbi:MAG TPA: hypothetical protein VK071_05865 [Tissierellales bacterium]|nr:hypothetical protein [Tissierellales bacterium]
MEKLANKELPYPYVYMRDTWNIVNNRAKNFEMSIFIDLTHPGILIEMELDNRLFLWWTI